MKLIAIEENRFDALVDALLTKLQLKAGDKVQVQDAKALTYHDVHYHVHDMVGKMKASSL